MMGSPPQVAPFYEGIALRLPLELIKLSNITLAICQNVKSFITIRPEELGFRGPGAPARRQPWRAPAAACWKFRDLVQSLRESDPEGGRGARQPRLCSPPDPLPCPCVPSPRQQTRLHHGLGEIPQRVSRARSGGGGGNGAGDGLPSRTLGHPPSECPVLVGNTGCEHGELPSHWK